MSQVQSVTYVSGLDTRILERAKGFEPSTPTLARSFLDFAAFRAKLLSFAKCKDFNGF